MNNIDKVSLAIARNTDTATEAHPDAAHPRALYLAPTRRPTQPPDDPRALPTALLRRRPHARNLRESGAHKDSRTRTTRPCRLEIATGGAQQPADGTRLIESLTDNQRSSALGELPQGFRIGRYRLLRELGRGGMGAVFLARDTRLGRLVAIKVLDIHDDDFNKRFIAEARATAKCSHDNIVVLFEADEFEGLPYMVLEYLEGKTLRQLMDEQRSARTKDGSDAPPLLLPVQQAVDILRPVLSALDHAHAMGIVHRDLKPENIMLTRDGRIKVLDFGIAKVLAEHDPSRTGEMLLAQEDGVRLSERSSGIMGTLPYMSPEQLNAADVDARTDIWALGIMLFEMVTGTHPLTPLSAPVLDKLAKGECEMPRASVLRPDLGRLADIIDCCLIRNRAERTATVGELRCELAALTRGRSERNRRMNSPFVGLSSYQKEDAANFHGRAADIAALLDRLRHQPLVTIVGPAGSGKSSLMRAGVIPALEGRDEGWNCAILRPGRQPLRALSEMLACLLPATATGSRSTSPARPGSTDDHPDESLTRYAGNHGALRERLSTDPGHAKQMISRWARGRHRRMLIFIDQLEELDTLGSRPEDQDAFLSCLQHLADDASSPVRVVLSIRSDYLPRIVGDPSFGSAVSTSLFSLGKLDRCALHACLVQPVEGLCHRYDDERLIECILDDLEDCDAPLPLLQLAASQLWHRRDQQRRLLTRTSFVELGGMAGILAHHADSVLSRMTREQRRIARAILERLVTPDRRRALARRTDLCALPCADQELEHVLRTLIAARLLVAGSPTERAEGDDCALAHLASASDDSTALTIAHERLITEWTTLRRWLEEHPDELEFLTRIRIAAYQWDRNQRVDGMLWHGEVARAAQLFDERYQGALAPRERAFLDAVLTRWHRARRRTWTTLFWVGIAVLLLLALTMTGIPGVNATSTPRTPATGMPTTDHDGRYALAFVLPASDAGDIVATCNRGGALVP